MDFERHYLGIWVTHDENACNALKEYDSGADHVPSPLRYMEKVAERHGTTIEEMRKHWKCIPYDERERVEASRIAEKIKRNR